MNRQKFKYFIFRYGLGWLPDSIFLVLIRFTNAFRFKKSYYQLSENSFFGKINRIKGLNLEPEMMSLADKSKMSKWLKQRYDFACFVPLIGVFKDVDELIGSDLKFPCIVKMNRGSGMNLVLVSHEELMTKQVLDTIRYWFTVDSYFYSRERHYSKMTPMLVVEEFLGDNINDYKVYCFNGVAKFIQVDIDRFNGHKRAFYDLDWNLLDLGMIYPRPNSMINQPILLNQMIEIASLISKSFEFVRVDFYVVENKLFLGECTFFPEGGMGLFDNRAQDEWVGAMFNNKIPIA
jgi:hypothetical protein